MSCLSSCLVPLTAQESGPSDGTTPLGSQLLVCFFLGIALWGRFPWWGGHWPLGTKVPHNDSPKGRGGPWPRHPAYSSQSCDVYSCFLSDSVNCLFLKKVCCFESVCEVILALQVFGPCLFGCSVLLGVRKGMGGWLRRPQRLFSF